MKSPTLVSWLLFVATGVTGSACAVCASDDDCRIGDTCMEGACAPRAANRFEVLSPRPDDEVGEFFDLVAEVSFQSDRAFVRVERGDEPVGDPCAPFLPATVVVLGDFGARSTQEVRLAGLRALGTRFSVRIILDDGVDSRAVLLPLRGPGTALSSDTLVEPPEGPVTTQDGFIPVRAQTQIIGTGTGTAWVEPVAGPPAPRTLVDLNSGNIESMVPVVRGDQILWLQTPQGRCGRGLVGLPEGDDGGDLEIAVLWQGGGPALLTASSHIAAPDGEAVVCDREHQVRCQLAVVSTRPEAQGTEVWRLAVQAATVRVAVQPAAASGPVSAWVRVALAGEHRGMFGPFPLVPAQGHIWLAGTVLVAADGTVGLFADDAMVGELPW